MKNYLFLFTISPVQAFIAQARKAQDLYAGSQMLSYLVKHAIRQLPNEAIVRFPAQWNSNNKAALPNRFLAEVTSDANEAQKLGTKTETKVQEEFMKIAENVLTNKKLDKPKGFDEQIQNHLAINWIFEPLEGQKYFEAFQNIENKLGAIKNFREYNQLGDQEQGRKDSLTGELNALFFNNRFTRPAFTDNAITFDSSGIMLPKGEGLSAISFVKRFYLDEAFPSTARIACLNTIKRIEYEPEFKDYKALFSTSKDYFDEQLLYEENLIPIYFYKQGLLKPLLNITENSVEVKMNEPVQKILNNKIDGKLEPFLTKYKALKSLLQRDKDNPLKFNKYYAVLVFDGDSMGKWLSGQPLGDQKKDDDLFKAYHKRFSELLADFATNASSYVDDNSLGKTIYSGGDDFLAMLNLENLFETLSELRARFDQEIASPLNEEFNTNEKLSFSAGLTIAHYDTPMGEVLNRARAMEQKAKDEPQKNSLAIAVMKKSGELQHATIKWGTLNNFVGNINSLNQIHVKLKDKIFSPAYISNLNRLFINFSKDYQKVKVAKLFDVETERLIKRAIILKPKNGDPEADYLQRKRKHMSELSGAITNIREETDVFRTLEILKIIDFIYRKS